VQQSIVQVQVCHIVQIWQCEQGHFLCGSCYRHESITRCPRCCAVQCSAVQCSAVQCRCRGEGFYRSRDLEAILAAAT
jgi:hypothetical protein